MNIVRNSFDPPTPVYVSPSKGWTACPASAVAEKRTAPPPMIPKLLAANEDITFESDNKHSPPGQSDLHVEKGGRTKWLGHSRSGSSWRLQPGPPSSKSQLHVAFASSIS